MNGSQPVLWHIPVSHYSEKARWALAHKGVEHERRAPLPGAHMAIALWLTRGQQKTFPVLQLDGRNIGDSTAVIEALETRWPDAPLYPEDPAERRRALELEDHFDEHVGPQVRLLGWHELRKDPELIADVSEAMSPAPLRKLPGSRAFAGRFGTTFTQLRYRVASDEAADAARRDVLAAFDRLEEELDSSGGEYLAGDRFSVADLTAAALLYPIIAPPEGPQILPDEPPAGFAAFQESVADRPGTSGSRRCSASTATLPPPPPRPPAPPRPPQAISTIASTSTGTSNGSLCAPIADRAWRPAGSPQTSSTRSVKPLITAGGLSKSSAHWTRPSALTQLVTRSRSPSSCSSEAKIESPVRRAAS